MLSEDVKERSNGTEEGTAVEAPLLGPVWSIGKTLTTNS